MTALVHYFFLGGIAFGDEGLLVSLVVFGPLLKGICHLFCNRIANRALRYCSWV
jgi:hypothetical protein